MITIALILSVLLSITALSLSTWHGRAAHVAMMRARAAESRAEYWAGVAQRYGDNGGCCE